MNLLIINSDALFEKNGEYYIHKNTGVFIDKLISKGLYVSMFHFKKDLSPNTVSDYKIDLSKIKIYGVKRSKFKLVSHLRATLSLVRQIKSIDFLYLFYPNAFFYSVFIALLLRKPYSIYLRGERNYKSPLSNFIYRHAKFVTSISPSFTQHVISVKGKSITIKPMIDFDINDIPDKVFKNNLNSYNLLYIGRVEKDKGIFELIEAVKILKKNNITNFKLNIIGNGVHYKQIEDLIVDGKVQEQVELHGVITDKETIKKFYIEADIFVFPSHHEGFPRVLYEAMIFKVPIITTFVGSIPYLMKDSYNCFKIQVNDPESIADKLAYAMNNSNQISFITNNAADTIKNYLKTNNLSHEQIIIENI